MNRRGLINIACGPGGSNGGNPSVMPVSFTQATGHEPNQPYIYTLDITSPVACGGIGGDSVALPAYSRRGMDHNSFAHLRLHSCLFGWRVFSQQVLLHEGVCMSLSSTAFFADF